ncbi:MAG: TrmH family RNA methyltransferase, partial [Chitinispirillia bacterium]
EEALADMDFVVGTSSKRRRIKFDYYPCSELTRFLLNKGDSVEKIALVFGREDKGLKNAEIQLCDIISTIPMKSSYPSINLAQSVMIFAYSLSSFSFKQLTVQNMPVHEVQLSVLKKNIALLLQKVGFSLKSSIYKRILERLGALNTSDTHLFYSVYNKISKKLHDKKY